MLRPLRRLAIPFVFASMLGSACGESGKDSSTGGSGGTAPLPEGGAEQGGSSSRAGSGGKSNGGKAGSNGSTAGSTNAGGRDAQGGAGGEGGAAPCPGCESGLCLADGTCVECLPSDDQCPDGKYCTEANECAAGCKASGAGCASGECDATHNCEQCINDAECVAPLLCSQGRCSAACTPEQDGTMVGCSDGLTCCAQHCAELATDSANCGSCGNACEGGQFCGIADCAQGGAGGASSDLCVTCHSTTLQNVCAISRVIVILDSTKNPSDGNRVPGRAVGKALETQCASSPQLQEAEQDSVEALNLTTGRPVSGGGELLVVAGGSFFQNLEGYLEEQRIAPLYSAGSGGFSEFRKSSDDSVVLRRAVDGDHDSQDDFIIQFTRDAASGSLILNLQGFWLSGTVAAVYQLTEVVMKQLSAFDKGWYAYTWVDGDGDLAPDADEITLVDSGN